MCNRASFIYWQDGTLSWSLKTDSHQGIIAESGKVAKDTEFGLRNFVALEVLPKGDPFSLNSEDWDVKVDEEGSLPIWVNYEEVKYKVLDELVGFRIPTWTFGKMQR